MSVSSEKFFISSKGFDDVVDITQKIQDVVSNFSIKNGVAQITLLASTASLITIDDEPGLEFDVSRLLENIVPLNKVYQHDSEWLEGNAHAHLKSIILGKSLNLPIVDSKIQLGSWQRIIFIDFDNKVQNREIIVSVIY
ncbi:YjbQ family protein [bacterium]|nr:YjbQ family protein [bacterium]MBQ9149646.1 YjbQ family protein [bacterium]